MSFAVEQIGVKLKDLASIDESVKPMSSDKLQMAGFISIRDGIDITGGECLEDDKKVLVISKNTYN